MLEQRGRQIPRVLRREGAYAERADAGIGLDLQVDEILEMPIQALVRGTREHVRKPVEHVRLGAGQDVAKVVVAQQLPDRIARGEVFGHGVGFVVRR